VTFYRSENTEIAVHDSGNITFSVIIDIWTSNPHQNPKFDG